MFKVRSIICDQASLLVMEAREIAFQKGITEIITREELKAYWEKTCFKCDELNLVYTVKTIEDKDQETIKPSGTGLQVSTGVTVKESFLLYVKCQELTPLKIPLNFFVCDLNEVDQSDESHTMYIEITEDIILDTQKVLSYFIK